MLFFFMQMMNYIFCKRINPENVVVFMECDSIRLELVVMHGTYVKTCKWPTIFIVVIFLCTMLFTYVAYIIYSSGNYMIFPLLSE